MENSSNSGVGIGLLFDIQLDQVNLVSPISMKKTKHLKYDYQC